MPRYAEWEDALLREHYGVSSPDFLLGLLKKRTWSSIKHRAQSLNLGSVRNPDWTIDEDRILRRCHPDLSKVAVLLPHRTQKAIRARSTVLQLKRVRRWTSPEIDLIRKLYSTHTDAQMGAMLGRTARAIEAKRKKLGLTHAKHAPGTAPHLLSDVLAEARRRSVKLGKLTKAMGCLRLRRATKDKQIGTISALVAAFSGEFYAEWDD